MKSVSKESPGQRKAVASNLVTRWRELKKKNEGMILARALEELNEALGRHYKHHHITRMERGERQPDVLLHNHLLRYVLTAELKGLVASDRDANRLFETLRLAEPSEEKG